MGAVLGAVFWKAITPTENWKTHPNLRLPTLYSKDGVEFGADTFVMPVFR
jgi:hypothetical protein